MDIVTWKYMKINEIEKANIDFDYLVFANLDKQLFQ